MPYFETGTPVEFTAADKVDMLTFALQGQNIGIVGTQNQPATVDSQTVNMFNTFTNQNLADIASEIGGKASASVRYMKMSWNLNGSTLTDLVIGFVATIGSVPNNGQDLVNALSSGPLGYVLGQISSYHWDSYIIGKPPVGTVHQELIFSTETKDYILVKTVLDEYGTKENAINIFRNTMIASIQNNFVSAVAETAGANVNVISAEVLNIELRESLDLFSRQLKYKLYMTSKVVFDSDTLLNETTQISQKLLPHWAIAVILILAVGTSVGVGVGLSNWISNQNVKSYENYYKKYGWELNPNTGIWERVVTEEGTEKWKEPDYGGILTTFISLAVVGLIAYGGLKVVGSLGGKKK